MDCFICKTSLTLRCMSKHFKLVHDLKEEDTYRCTYNNGCYQYYNRYSSLVRHFKAHLNMETSVNVGSKSNFVVANINQISPLNPLTGDSSSSECMSMHPKSPISDGIVQQNNVNTSESTSSSSSFWHMHEKNISSECLTNSIEKN